MAQRVVALVSTRIMYSAFFPHAFMAYEFLLWQLRAWFVFS